MLFPVVHADRKTDHFRSYRAIARPRINDGFIVRFQLHDFFHELLIDVWTFFETAGHIINSFSAGGSK